jgi:hypothetical protein
MAGSLKTFVTLCSGSVLLVGAALSVTFAATEPGASPGSSRPLRLLVLDVELAGDLGGPALSTEHETRLQMTSARLRSELAHTALFQIVDDSAVRDAIGELRSQQRFLHECNGCDLEIGRRAGADRVMVAWVYRVSGLILTLTYEIHDVRTAQITDRRSYDFRGDNDAAWTHAIVYLVRDLKERALGVPVRSP